MSQQFQRTISTSNSATNVANCNPVMRKNRAVPVGCYNGNSRVTI